MKGKILILAVFFFATAGLASAEIYYVDFDNGNDANSGMSESQAWRTVPGNTLYTSWGSNSTLPYSHAIDSSHKIPVGSTIYIKAGTTYSSTDPSAGNIGINPYYYSAPAQESERITITVSDTWGSGNVVIDGSGLVYNNPTPDTLFHVWTLSYITVKGADSSRKLIFQSGQSGKNGAALIGLPSSHDIANQMSYVEVYNFRYGFSTAYNDNFILDHMTFHDNSEMGISIGAGNDANCDNGTLQNSEAYNNGQPDTSNTGIQVVGSINITIKNCTSHNNPSRNYDYGTVSNTNPCTVTTIDSISYNGLDGGFCANGGPGLEDKDVFTYVNCISYNDNPNNFQRGGFHAYAGCTVYWYNCISDKRGMAGDYYALFSMGAEPESEGGGSVKAYARNCVGYAPSGTSGSQRHMFFILEPYDGPRGSHENVTLDSDYNIFDSGAINPGQFYIIEHYSYPNVGTILEGNFMEWQNLTHLGGSGQDRHSGISSSIHTYWQDVANHDYHIISSSSPLVNAGIYLSSPQAVLTDRDGNPRSNPPEIGPYEFAPSSCIHKSDSDCSGCVSDQELYTFIDNWYVDSSNPTTRELIEAIGLWKRGC